MNIETSMQYKVSMTLSSAEIKHLITLLCHLRTHLIAENKDIDAYAPLWSMLDALTKVKKTT